MWVLELLGTLSLRNETAPVPVAAQQRRSLGLLAILALAGRQGFSRERIESYLWPESSAPLARHSLDQTVYAIRHALGSESILSSGRELRLNPGRIEVDLWSFEEAIRTRQWAAAATRYRGTLLDGFHFSDSREFESWIDGERDRLRDEYQTALEFLANAAREAGDHSRSVAWWRRLANSEPLSAGATKNLMLALSAAGDRAGAVKHARLYQELVRQELEIEPDSEIENLAMAFSHAAVPEIPAAETDPHPHSRVADDPGRLPSAPLVTPSVEGWTREKAEGGRRERAALFAVIPFAVLMTGAAIWGWMRPATSKRVVRYTLVVDSTEAMARGTPWSGRVAISPDGSRLAYVGGPRSLLLIRAFNELRAVAVPETEGVATPFFSPDGRRVGFLREKTVQIASPDGGSPITVADSLTGVAGASWGPDNFIYADGYRAAGLVRVEARPGAVPKWFTSLDTASGEFDHAWPDVLPNGKGVVFTVRFNGRNGAKGRTSYAIAVADIPSGKHRVIVSDAVYARFARSGHLLYVTTKRTLMVVPFDQSSMKVSGEPTALTEGMRLGGLGSADLAVSDEGTLVYATGAARGQQELVWVTRDGKAQAVDSDWSGVYLGFPALSPDGKLLAVARDANAESMRSISVWIKRLDRGPSSKLTLEGGSSYGPVWTPDGRFVTFASSADKGVNLWTKRADGSAQAVRQLHEKWNVSMARWSPDGKWLILQTVMQSPGKGDILAMRPGVDSAPVPLLATTFTETSPALSPNGRWLAYTSNESGEYEVYVVPFPNTGAAKWAISASGGTEPLWSHQGRELFYRDASGNLVVVDVNTTPTFSLGRSTTLFPAAGYTSERARPQYAVGPDDQRFLMIRPQETTTADKLIVVENWFEELRTKPRTRREIESRRVQSPLRPASTRARNIALATGSARAISAFEK